MRVAILHYSLPPVVGGVETVIHAHAGMLLKAGIPVTLIAGAGEESALPPGADFIQIPEMDSRHPRLVQISQQLESGVVPADFVPLTALLERSLLLALGSVDTVMVHNIFTKHFNIPLTAALIRVLDRESSGTVSPGAMILPGPVPTQVPACTRAIHGTCCVLSAGM